ncbi:hypothetical protein [Klebsiella pasteurii]|uniref:hypothetical protein n=1 Tax=Klebsiella pasteurii TaxID=2587529 RepID=UPI002542FA8D|nr:hypothetical protein [Klebsiella pasteurii]WII85102.1 hypothetical protein N5863_29325 [Klebsiella pasteurii]WND12993.1 hypothetical protein RIV03_28065 [Klebsiella pasteurii]
MTVNDYIEKAGLIMFISILIFFLSGLVFIVGYLIARFSREGSLRGKVSGVLAITALATGFISFWLLVYFLLNVAFKQHEAESARKGDYYINECVLQEDNIPTGLFSENMNRLKCGQAVVNVEKRKYDNAISSYNKARQQR